MSERLADASWASGDSCAEDSNDANDIVASAKAASASLKTCKVEPLIIKRCSHSAKRSSRFRFRQEAIITAFARFFEPSEYIIDQRRRADVFDLER